MTNTPRAKARILVIDDSEITLSRARDALSAAGYDVVATTQIVGAAKHLRGCDLVLIDFHMPGRTGSEVLESLRAAAAGAERPPLFYLYSTDANVSADATHLGFDGAITGKGDAAVLVSQVNAATRVAKLRALRR